MSYLRDEAHPEQPVLCLVCDDCGRRVKPGSPGAEDWTKSGTYFGPGDSRNRIVNHHCRQCGPPEGEPRA